MAVNIEVNLNRIDTRDIAEIERQLSSIGDGIDLDFDFDDLIDGDFEEIDVQLVGDDVDLSDLNLSSGKDSDTSLADIQTELKRINGTILGTSGAEGRSSSSSDSSSDSKSRFEVSIPDRLRDKGGYNIPRPKTRDIPNRLLSGSGYSLPRKTSLPQIGLDNKSREFGLPDHIYEMAVERKKGLTLPSKRQLRQKEIIQRMAGGKLGAESVKGQTTEVLNSEPSKLKKLKRNSKAMNRASENIGGTLKKLRPTSKMIRGVIYTMLPAIAALGVQLGAVAVGMGAVASAAGIVGLLGMLGGEADTLSGSMKQAENRMKNFKQSLFQAIDPVADLFGPVVDKFLSVVVQKVGGLTDELAALRGFSGVLFAGLHAAGFALERILQTVISLGPKLREMAGGAMSFLSTSLPEFFGNVLAEGINTSDMLARVGGLIWQVGRIIYFLIKGVTYLVSILSGLAPILRVVGNLLGNEWVQSIFVLITYLGSLVLVGLAFGKAVLFMSTVVTILNTAMTTQLGLLGVLRSTWTGQWIMSAVSAIGTLMTYVMGLNSLLAQAAALMSIVTLGGAALIGVGALTAGFMSTFDDAMNPEMSRSNSGSVYNDVTMNFQGDMDNSSRWSMEDSVKDVKTSSDLSGGNFGATR